MVPIRVTDKRNVLLKCRHSMLSMIRYYAAAGHVVLVFLLNAIIIPSVLLSMIRAYCCCCSAMELWFFFWPKLTFFIRPGTWCWYYVLLLLLDGTAPSRSIHAQKSAGNTFMHAACVYFLGKRLNRVYPVESFALIFCPILVYFLRMTLSSSLPFGTHIRGRMARTPPPSPLPCLPSSF